MSARRVLLGTGILGILAVAIWPSRFDLEYPTGASLNAAERGHVSSIQLVAHSLLGNRTGCWLAPAPTLAPREGVAAVDPGPRDGYGCQSFRVTNLGSAGRVVGEIGFAGSGARLSYAVNVAPDARDLDGNGYPDGTELHSAEDKRAFRAWFAAIAELEARHPCECWDAAQRDCAGLVRFAFREALRRHDAKWSARIGWDGPVVAPDVARFNYPGLPILGEQIFRVRGGSFAGLQDFDVAPTAERLVAGSLEPLPRGTAWETGDVLYFSDRAAHVSHLMIISGDRVVYHTGAEGMAGEVRIVRIEALRTHPDPSWRPVVANPAFAGAYRWKMLSVGRD